MIPMNMFKKNGGFTLVELIVVIAILAILAGVAVPAYSGYITKAQEASDITQLDAIQTAAQAAFATKGQVGKIVVVDSTDSVTVYLVENDAIAATGEEVLSGTTDAAKDFQMFFDGEIDLKSETYDDGATWQYKDDSSTTNVDEYGWNP